MKDWRSVKWSLIGWMTIVFCVIVTLLFFSHLKRSTEQDDVTSTEVDSTTQETTTATSSTLSPEESELKEHIAQLLDLYPNREAHRLMMEEQAEELRRKELVVRKALAMVTTTASPEEIARRAHIRSMLQMWPTAEDLAAEQEHYQQLIRKATRTIGDDLFSEGLDQEERRAKKDHVFHLLDIFPDAPALRKFLWYVDLRVTEAGFELPPSFADATATFVEEFDFEHAAELPTTTAATTTTTTTATTTTTTTTTTPYIYREDPFAHHPVFICSRHHGMYGVDGRIERMLKSVLKVSGVFDTFCREMKKSKYGKRLHRIKKKHQAKILSVERREPITKPLPVFSSTSTESSTTTTTEKECPVQYCPSCPTVQWLKYTDEQSCREEHPCKLRLKECRKKFPCDIHTCGPICLNKAYHWCTEET